MKLSLKLQDQNQNPQSHHHHHHHHPFLLRAKVPISVFGLPFLSAATAAADLSDPTLSLRTSFPSGPSLKLSYNPTSAATTTSGAASPPLTLSLKSGVSFFGSPRNSPLIISAHFTPSSQNPNPTFSLQFKPQLGNFSLSKTTHSSPPPTPPNPNPNKTDFGVSSFQFVPLERPNWKDMTMESCTGKNSVLSGIAVNARTVLPVTKRVAVNFRWGVNFPADFGKQLPYLSVNKIGLERVDEVKEAKEVKDVKGSERSAGDFEVLKCVFLQMGRELDVLRKENREIKHVIEEMKFGSSVRNRGGDARGAAKKPLPVVENSGGFEQWRNKKSAGEDNGRKEIKKSVNSTKNVESELERAIKAASSS